MHLGGDHRLAELPRYVYLFIDPKGLEVSDRIRWICQHECPMYGKSWACPPGTGEVAACSAKCKGYEKCLMIGTITETADISNMEQTLKTRPEHEKLTNQIRDLFREQGVEPYILSTEACAVCERCAILDDSFRGKIAPYLLNFLKLLTEKGYIRQFSHCFEAYRACYNEDHNFLSGTAVTAVVLSKEQMARLTEKLQTVTGKSVELTCRIDPQCMGGVRLELEGKCLDDTVAHRFESVRQLLQNTVL